MRDARRRPTARSSTEVLAAVAICLVVLALLLPVLNGAVERAWAARCSGQLGELFRALSLYLHPDHGDHWLPAGGPGGPCWFDTLEPFVAGYRTGQAPQRFVCPQAPLEQRGFTRDSLSYGWNAWDFPPGSVTTGAMSPREKLVLGDSLGSGPGAAAPHADTLVTADGELRLDARHGGEARLLFLDGHVESCSRPRASERWAAWTLAAPRPVGETPSPLGVLRWWQWALVAACVVVPGVVVLVGLPYLAALQAARAQERLEREEAAARAAKVQRETAREAVRHEHLRHVPAGPVEPVALPRAVLHVGRRSFELCGDRELVIGRGDHADVRIHNSHTVSREHAKIRPEPRGYVLYDLCSRAGTFVGAARVESRVLAHRDRIRLGEGVQLVFRLVEQGLPAGPARAAAADLPSDRRSPPPLTAPVARAGGR